MLCQLFVIRLNIEKRLTHAPDSHHHLRGFICTTLTFRAGADVFMILTHSLLTKLHPLIYKNMVLLVTGQHGAIYNHHIYIYITFINNLCKGSFEI